MHFGMIPDVFQKLPPTEEPAAKIVEISAPFNARHIQKITQAEAQMFLRSTNREKKNGRSSTSRDLEVAIEQKMGIYTLKNPGHIPPPPQKAPPRPPVENLPDRGWATSAAESGKKRGSKIMSKFSSLASRGGNANSTSSTLSLSHCSQWEEDWDEISSSDEGIYESVYDGPCGSNDDLLTYQHLKDHASTIEFVSGPEYIPNSPVKNTKMRIEYVTGIDSPCDQSDNMMMDYRTHKSFKVTNNLQRPTKLFPVVNVKDVDGPVHLKRFEHPYLKPDRQVMELPPNDPNFLSPNRRLEKTPSVETRELLEELRTKFERLNELNEMTRKAKVTRKISSTRRKPKPAAMKPPVARKPTMLRHKTDRPELEYPDRSLPPVPRLETTIMVPNPAVPAEEGQRPLPLPLLSPSSKSLPSGQQRLLMRKQTIRRKPSKVALRPQANAVIPIIAVQMDEDEKPPVPPRGVNSKQKEPRSRLEDSKPMPFTNNTLREQLSEGRRPLERMDSEAVHLNPFLVELRGKLKPIS